MLEPEITVKIINYRKSGTDYPAQDEIFRYHSVLDTENYTEDLNDKLDDVKFQAAILLANYISENCEHENMKHGQFYDSICKDCGKSTTEIMANL